MCEFFRILAFCLLINSPCSGQMRLVNVALSKECNMSSTYYPDDDPALAVNNNTAGNFNGKPPNCIHTGNHDRDAWWEVDLGRPYPVYNITVWARTGFSGRMAGCVITVDGQICFNITSKPSFAKLAISCSSGVIVGRKVRISKKTPKVNNSSDEIFINVCEFQVWSCSDQYWGTQCEHKCGNCSDEMVCDKVTGHCLCKSGFKPPLCTEECNTGTYGQNCSRHCSENCVGVCDRVTGQCQCFPGWKPSMCDAACDIGFYGKDCLNECGSCVRPSHCNSSTGVCRFGCTENFIGDMCQTVRQEEKISYVGPIVGSIFGVGVVLAIILITGIILVKRSLRRRERENSTGTPTPAIKEMYVTSSMPVGGEYENCDVIKNPDNTYDEIQKEKIYENTEE